MPWPEFNDRPTKKFDELSAEMQEVVRDWLDDLKHSDYGGDIEGLECERRDGFIPHSYNKGGYRLKCFTNLAEFEYGSLDLPPQAAKVAKEYVKRTEQLTIQCLREEGIKVGPKYRATDEYFDKFYADLQDDYSSIYHEIMVMYDGHLTFEITLQHCIEDAPYHRKQNFQQNWQVKAKTAAQLQKALEHITAQVKGVWI